MYIFIFIQGEIQYVKNVDSYLSLPMFLYCCRSYLEIRKKKKKVMKTKTIQ